MTGQSSAGPVWLALLDARKGRLLQASTTARGSIHLEERDGLQEQWEEHEHLRIAPSINPDRGSHTDWRRQETERVRRFAREAAAWLGRCLEGGRIERLTVLCSPKLLGQLRQELVGSLTARVELVRGDLAHVPLPDLATHPALAQIVARAPDAGGE